MRLHAYAQGTHNFRLFTVFRLNQLPQTDVGTIAGSDVRASSDRKTVSATLPDLKPDRVYELTLRNLAANHV